MGYHEICLNIKNNGWTKVKGSKCTVGPHAYKGNQWVGYDDLETVKIKVRFKFLGDTELRHHDFYHAY